MYINQSTESARVLSAEGFLFLLITHEVMLNNLMLKDYIIQAIGTCYQLTF